LIGTSLITRTGTLPAKCGSGLLMRAWRSSLLMSVTPASAYGVARDESVPQQNFARRMKLLVTGANGFIGRHLVAKLSHNHEVFALARNEHYSAPNKRVSVVAMDLGFALDLSQLPAKIDVIVHLAQANARFPEGANELLAVNTVSTQQLLDYGRRAEAETIRAGFYGRCLRPAFRTV
jgi:hypothetical protein